ncbi:1-acyl-sn-glycerol-3-phosphate acyltransferase [Neolewinella persica]|uniref:1-acyl-sn-glycerol-3-phosphate acyltransferase n=1 Tax=Neolewinella persica TaxID=70998 RepID=UPI00035F6D49|nr:1-acyl-sn-glycerol-3-phosphate acyltransferase [Neolewinella persica]
MVYYLVRPVARYILRYYYRNIDITGLENIPADAPVILAANHPTAFIEPCIMACFQPRTLWFLARGNLFKNSFFIALLNAVNILPVYRLEDGGYTKLKDNFDTFDACYKALSLGRAIMILAEGRTIHEKALRPIRKGTARIALGALERDPALKEVYIVPVGANFTNADRVRGQVMVRCGKPILASEYLAEYRSGEANAIKNLTSHLRSRLSSLVVQFPDQARANIGEGRLVLHRNDVQAGQTYGITHDGKQLDQELGIAANTPEKDPELAHYFNALYQQGIVDGAVVGAKKRQKQGAVPWVKVFLASLFQLPQLPLWLLAEFIGASQPRHIEFYSPVRFAALAVGTLLIYPTLLLLLPWAGKTWLLVSIFTVGWSLRQLEKVQQWYANRKMERMVAAERGRLVKMREEVSAGIKSFSAEEVVG